ncbi:DUF1553 domain-containing protein [bacterium]|nr:DUF1553 domain-containing protein [bacterium]
MSPFASAALLLSFSLASAGDALVTRWDFGTEEATPVTVHGNVQRDQAGPRPPEFPDMAASNTAIRVDSSAYLAVSDPGPDSDFDFTNGDAITIEAWVNPASIRDASPRYIIGKGRTGSPRFSRDNQNWALRIVGQKSNVHLSFLFATRLSAGDRHWHRWTSKAGFPVSTGWHHIAVSYRFGDPKSVRGWIDGVATDGTWDMGGATTEPPVVDDDEVRIGNSYAGLLDAVAVHRAALDDKVLAARFNRVGGPRVAVLQKAVMPDVPDVMDGRVVVQISEGLPTNDRWLYEGEMWPAESARWTGDSFLLPRLPLHFDDWGLRTGWTAPLLLRMAADVELPAGEHTFLVRARSLGRLWIDGQLVAEMKPYMQRPPDGEEPITPVPEPPLPGLRRHGYHQQEVSAVISLKSASDSGRRRVVFEVVVGGSGIRTETGEICVAVQTPDGRSYNVLTPAGSNQRLPLTDVAIESALAEIEASLSRYDDETRRATAASLDEFWKRRHDVARNWAQQHPAPAVPQVASTQHPVDAFIMTKIDRALAAASSENAEQAAHFHRKVLPILRENCFRCHGDKDKGGLKLNSREAALKSGDSEIPAVVPGDVMASELIARIRTNEEGLRMPPTDEGLSDEQVQTLEAWVKAGAYWPPPPLSAGDVAFSRVVSDEAFLRRVYLDTVGVPPTPEEIRSFTGPSGNRSSRNEIIDRLLNDDRFADQWMTFWLDLLAENPSLLNASLNSTGPFRWFIYDALRDQKPLDRMVTELLLMRGGAAEGGSAGFAQAGENDSPFAAKGHIVASAFLGIELQCARCHDSPYHSTTQRDLYSLAAMFDRKPVTVPVTSRVPAAFFEKNKTRESLIRATLSPDEPIVPEWPFADVTGASDGPEIDRLMAQPNDSRERLAALITAPQNERFSRVIVNRVWKQLIGAGLVEPVHDWEGNAASHPELLDWLAHQLVSHDYDLRHIVRLIVSSEMYQREASGWNLEAAAEQRFFNAPERRRLTAEQIVDSLHVATGHPIDVEELTFVHDGRRPLGSRLTLGRPTRAWMFGDLKNERDRPSLSLPRARAVADVLEAFGWTGARQKPIAERETEPNVLQPGVLANGVLSVILTRASWHSDLADLAIKAPSAEWLVEELFLRTLGRRPRPDERSELTTALASGFDQRLVPADKVSLPDELPPLPQVTWFNHLQPRANEIQLEIEQRVRRGPPADPRIQAAWREVYEDVVWSLINDREFAWMP